MMDVRRGLQRYASVVLAKFERELVVHDVIHHPQRHLGDKRGELADLDAIKLVDVDLREMCNVQECALPSRVQLFQHFHLELTKLAVRDDEKVATPAGGIEET